MIPVSIETIVRVACFLPIPEIKKAIEFLGVILEEMEELEGFYEEAEELFEEQLKNERCID